MKISLLVVSLFFALSLFAQPQPERNRPSAEEMAKMQTQSMVDELKLSDKQTQEVSAINLKYMKKITEAFESIKGDREAMRSRMNELRTQMTDEFKTVLTPEQFAKLQEMEKQMNAERRQAPPAEAK